jgi:NAD(P)-dependent dehydrogenase (short-subunit alcohol dehydrogenase family)
VRLCEEVARSPPRIVRSPGRSGTAEEAAASALLLMANSYVTGQILTIDGGETLS